MTMDDRLSSSLRLLTLNEDLQKEILSYFTVAERYGISKKSIVQFVRKHTTRVRRRQPVNPYYITIRHLRKMCGLLRYTSSMFNNFCYRHSHNRFQLNITLFRDYHSDNSDHILFDWVIDVFPQWKRNINISMMDAIYETCHVFQSKLRRRSDNQARLRLENMTRMTDRVEMFLIFGCHQQDVPVGYFSPTEKSIIVTQQYRLQVAYQLVHELSVFLESTISRE